MYRRRGMGTLGARSDPRDDVPKTVELGNHICSSGRSDVHCGQECPGWKLARTVAGLGRTKRLGVSLMWLEVFSVVVLVGALVVLIPTARRVFKKGEDE